MTTKEYLLQISRLNRVVENKFEEIKQLRDLSQSVRAIDNTKEKVDKTPNFDKIGTAVAKIDELEQNLDALIDEYVDKKNLIISQIDSMEDEMFYTVLFSRYVEKKTFEMIATETSYCYRQITRIHGNALKEFEKEYGETYLDL